MLPAPVLGRVGGGVQPGKLLLVWQVGGLHSGELLGRFSLYLHGVHRGLPTGTPGLHSLGPGVVNETWQGVDVTFWMSLLLTATDTV